MVAPRGPGDARLPLPGTILLRVYKGESLQVQVLAHGFEFEARNVSFPYLWWSRWDLGILERLGIRPRAQGEREETLVNLVARKGK